MHKHWFLVALTESVGSLLSENGQCCYRTFDVIQLCQTCLLNCGSQSSSNWLPLRHSLCSNYMRLVEKKRVARDQMYASVTSTGNGSNAVTRKVHHYSLFPSNRDITYIYRQTLLMLRCLSRLKVNTTT